MRFEFYFENLWKGVLASLSRNTTSLGFCKLRLGTQFTGSGGPVFALTSYAPAGYADI
jgi:hypothetical protein